MQEPELIALSPEDRFQFDCHPRIACFNHCCRELNQALTPYDVLQLRTYLQLGWEAFLQRHAYVFAGPASGLPVVSLVFSSSNGQRCPFVSDDGCSVYAARPTSCRLYPVMRALHRSRADGHLTVHYALLKEPHCHGFEQNRTQTVGEWIAGQGAEPGLAANDRLLALIALKNRLRPGPLDQEHQQWAIMALYDLDRLKAEAGANRLVGMSAPSLAAIPQGNDDAAWLSWGQEWLSHALFGTPSSGR
ncbi:MAG: hypothetical protein VR64_17505 [Desulfatitalea sp. BRH_c12]|nr:MAG: hypothetical protein VR64_17505 [Desulfatitalea sp. BRH_c12]